jgi:hypothetical protein
MVEPAVQAPRPTITRVDPDAASQELPLAPSAHVAGTARDELGFALTAHVIEVSSEQGVVEGSAESDDHGHFRIEGLSSGVKTLRLLGPGAGDVWRWVQDVNAPLDSHAALQVEEKRLVLAVPTSGVEEVVLKARGHRDILVKARLVDDARQPIDSHAFQFGQVPRPYAIGYSTPDGAIAGLVTVQENRSVELILYDTPMGAFRDALAKTEPRALEPQRRYMPVEVQLRTEPREQDLGTLVLPRMAGLALSLVDGRNGQGIADASIRLRCNGGGAPPTDEQVGMPAEGRCILWSGRASGGYELDVTAPGYRPAHEVGVLVAGDGPQMLELTLERAR